MKWGRQEHETCQGLGPALTHTRPTAKGQAVSKILTFRWDIGIEYRNTIALGTH